MKKSLLALSALLVVVLLAGTLAAPAKAAPVVAITLLNPVPGGLLELAVGESYTFDILITSDEPFVLAAAMTNAYYPGRGVFWHGGDHATQSTSAMLHLTVTGKGPTAGLLAVCDWPAPGTCHPAGSAPLAIMAGARFKGGVTVAGTFAFAVRVP
ncbi:MAG: hypothetical protein FJZ96_01855 [Chloroflexi bacterium]|nr:hypothetical protein [Chloroflexota bacterium]